MRIFRRFRLLPAAWRGASVAIGNFDGLHRGHRAVIEAAAAPARRLEAALGVITFEPHPREVLNPAKAPRRLTPLRQKLATLDAMGVGLACVLPFEPALFELPAVTFVERVLVEAMGIRAIAAGADFRFGHRRAGDLDLLRELGARHGFSVGEVAAVLDEGLPCSSTRIRAFLAQGDIHAANRLLGRSFEVQGIVRPGDRRGRELGFPTANLHRLGRRTLLPATGIYVVRAALADAAAPIWHPAVASLGVNPTFDGQDLRLEVHLLDGEHALYGRRLRVAFIERLRDEERYATIPDLVAQIEQDCRAARRIHAALPA